MRTISRNKITGKRINGLAARAKMTDGEGIRLGRMSRWVDKEHISACTENSGEPLMGAEAEGKMIAIEHIAKVFDD